MMQPDVTEIINDPDIGGGQAFTVQRKTVTRIRGGATEATETINAVGNIQPAQDIDLQQMNLEDTSNEVIVIYTTTKLQTGSNHGGSTFTAADEVIFGGERWRVLRVMPWTAWGFVIAYATKVKEGA